MKLKEKIKNNEKLEKLKKYKESFDTAWSNPKTHSAILLSFWFIAILILSLLVRFFPEKNTIEEPIREEKIIFSPTSEGIKKYLKSIKSYQANILIDDIEFKITDIGSKRIINNNNINYFYDGTLYQMSDEGKVITDDKNILTVNFFNIENIYNLIENINEEYITIYKDGSYIALYNIPIKEFYKKYDDSIIDSEENIVLTISGINDINKIEIDLSNIEFEYKKIIINLENKNNIEKIEF